MKIISKTDTRTVLFGGLDENGRAIIAERKAGDSIAGITTKAIISLSPEELRLIREEVVRPR